MKSESVDNMKNQVTNEGVNTKPQSTGTIEITPHHRKDIEYISFGKLHHFRNDTTKRSSHTFATLQGHYGYRCFTDQVFQQDVMIPNKSLHYIEEAAENWVNGIIK